MLILILRIITHILQKGENKQTKKFNIIHGKIPGNTKKDKEES